MTARQTPDAVAVPPDELSARCELLRSLHVPGQPLVLPNAWDVPAATAVVEAGFPAVATTSGGVAAALGYEDHEGAPPQEMMAAAARIARAVDVPVTVDAEAGYGMEPDELVAALRAAGAAGCNLEDTDHRSETLRDAAEHAAWLRAVRDAASAARYPLTINARIDVFLAELLSGSEAGQAELVEDALERASAYTEVGADCVYPIALWEPEPLRRFVVDAPAPVNVLRTPQVEPIPTLAEVGVARVSWGGLLQRGAVQEFAGTLRSIRAEADADRGAAPPPTE